MKLVLQIAFGVFLGTLAANTVLETWHTRSENTKKLLAEKKRIDQASERLEQGKRIRDLLMHNSKPDSSIPSKPFSGFVPDDAQETTQ